MAAHWRSALTSSNLLDHVNNISENNIKSLTCKSEHICVGGDVTSLRFCVVSNIWVCNYSDDIHRWGVSGPAHVLRCDHMRFSSMSFHSAQDSSQSNEFSLVELTMHINAVQYSENSASVKTGPINWKQKYIFYTLILHHVVSVKFWDALFFVAVRKHPCPWVRCLMIWLHSRDLNTGFRLTIQCTKRMVSFQRRW